jgi:ATP-dependent Lhr-like helicase
MSRRWLDEESAAGLGRLDTAAIDRVRAEAWPTAENADELHDALLGVAFITEAEVARNEPWQQFLATLMEAKRVTKLAPQPAQSTRRRRLWVAAERLPQFAACSRRAVFRRRSPRPPNSPRRRGRPTPRSWRSSADACRDWGR